MVNFVDAALAAVDGAPPTLFCFEDPPEAAPPEAAGAASVEFEKCTRARLELLPFDPSVAYPDIIINLTQSFGVGGCMSLKLQI